MIFLVITYLENAMFAEALKLYIYYLILFALMP
jgi:hypothetical protein